MTPPSTSSSNPAASLESVLSAWTAESIATLQKLPALAPDFARFGHALMSCWHRRGKVLTCGNGGSMTDAMHFAEELSVRFKKNRRALAAFALCDPSAITCAGNDFGYDTIFSRQVEALATENDIVVVFSTSGNSPNCLKAIEAAKSMNIQTAAFLGHTGGALKGLSTYELLVPSPHTAHVQEGHKALYHALCEWIDTQL